MILLNCTIQKEKQKSNRPTVRQYGASYPSGVRLFRNEPVFNFLTRPRGFAQEREAGFHCRIELETSDRNATPHFAPTMSLDQLINDAFQGDAVQRIARMGGGSRHK